MSKQLVCTPCSYCCISCFLFTKETVLSTNNLLLLLLTFSVQNKEFVHRGLPYEQLGSFRRRLNYEFPNAEVGNGKWLEPSNSYTAGIISDNLLLSVHLSQLCASHVPCV